MTNKYIGVDPDKGGFAIFEPLLGKVFTRVYQEDDQLFFENDTEKFAFYHDQDCCECVEINEVVGDLKDLENQPILLAEVVWDSNWDGDEYESTTWSYYKFRTLRGDVTVAWRGQSNGYYSERVSFAQVKGDEMNVIDSCYNA